MRYTRFLTNKDWSARDVLVPIAITSSRYDARIETAFVVLAASIICLSSNFFLGGLRLFLKLGLSFQILSLAFGGGVEFSGVCVIDFIDLLQCLGFLIPNIQKSPNSSIIFIKSELTFLDRPLLDLSRRR